MNVDLPQPDGPISAVTRRASICSEHRSSTLRLPNHALTFVARSSAGLLRIAQCAHAPFGSGVGKHGGHRVPPSRLSAATRDEASGDEEHEHEQDEDQRPGPRTVDLGLVGQEDQLADEQRQVGLRPVERVDVHRVGAERGEQHRRGLADRAGDRQQRRGDDAGQRGGEHDASARVATAERRARRRPRAACREPCAGSPRSRGSWSGASGRRARRSRRRPRSRDRSTQTV